MGFSLIALSIQRTVYGVSLSLGEQFVVVFCGKVYANA
jgi:hypothetical protein